MQSKDQRKVALETLMELFQHPGWELFKADMKILSEFGRDNAVEACSTNDQWQEWRGRARAYQFVMGYDQMIGVSLETIDDEDNLTNSLED